MKKMSEDIFGKFYDLKMVHEKENSSKIKRRVLSYDYIGEKLGELLKAFLEGIIYIDHCQIVLIKQINLDQIE